MTHQVVGVFDQLSDAQEAVKDLEKAGFDRDEIHLFGRTTGTTETVAADRDDESVWERIKEFFGFADETEHAEYHEAYRRGHVALAVDADSDAEVQHAMEILQRCKAMDLNQRAHQWRQEGWAPRAASASSTTAASTASRPSTMSGNQDLRGTTGATARPATPAARSTAGSAAANGPASTQGEVIPVVKEDIQIGKRQVAAGGVRIYSRVCEEPVSKDVELREERVEVERRPADRPVNPSDRAFQERAIEATETREEPVVRKDARVVEEVAVKKDVETRTETVKDTVRRTEVDVQKIPGSQAPNVKPKP